MYGASPGGQQAGYGTGQDLFAQSVNYATPGAYGAFAPQQAGYGGSQVQSTQDLESVTWFLYHSDHTARTVAVHTACLLRCAVASICLMVPVALYCRHAYEPIRASAIPEVLKVSSRAYMEVFYQGFQPFADEALCFACRLHMEALLKDLEQCLALAQGTVQQPLLRRGCPLMASRPTMSSQGRNETQAMTRSAE